jgi:hypothetical protein
MEDIRFAILPAADIDLIRPMWEKLNEIHYRQSPYFADEYKAFSFEKRKEKLSDRPGKRSRPETSGRCLSTSFTTSIRAMSCCWSANPDPGKQIHIFTVRA